MPCSTELFCYTATLLLIFSGLTGAAIRWFHICSPFVERTDFYYPARKRVTAFYAGFILLIPYMLDVSSSDTWFLYKAFTIIYYPTGYSLILFRYFHDYSPKSNRWFEISTIAAIIFLLSSASISLSGDHISRHLPIFGSIAIVIGINSMAIFFYSVLWLRKLIKQYNEENFSNHQDFPLKFANKLIVPPIICEIIIWSVAIIDSPLIGAINSLLFTVLLWISLLIILHTQRKEEEIPTLLITENLKENSDNDLLARIDKALNSDCLYLNPNLTLQQLAQAIGSNRSYVSQTIVENYGSFIRHINSLRIHHALNLRESNPELTQIEIMELSGFNSPTSFRKWMKEFGGESTDRPRQNRQI